MGYCKNCGKEIDDGTKFCPDCGATLEEQPQVETKPEVPRWEGENGEEKKGLVYAGFALALCSIFTLFAFICSWCRRAAYLFYFKK